MSNINIRVDETLKKDAETLFNGLGLNLTTAITVFLNQSVREQKIPFEVTKKQKNVELLEAIVEAYKLSTDESAKTYDNFTEVLKEIDV